MIKEYFFDLELYGHNYDTGAEFVQIDTDAYSLYITLLKHGIPINLSGITDIVMTILRPSEQPIIGTCEVVDIEGKIKYNILGNEINETGLCKAQISVYGLESKPLTWQDFTFNVRAKLDDGSGIPSEPEYNILNDLIVQTGEAITEANEAADYAKEQGDSVGNSAEYARTQGDYAKSQGESAEAITAEVQQKLDDGDFIGPEGPQGPQGISGQDGAQGPQGIQGPKGDIGVSGPKGDTGEPGPAGENGTDGASGLDGKDAQINGVNVLDLVAGDNITLEQDGSELTISATGSGLSQSKILYATGTVNNFTIDDPEVSVPYVGHSIQVAFDKANTAVTVYITINGIKVRIMTDYAHQVNPLAGQIIKNYVYNLVCTDTSGAQPFYAIENPIVCSSNYSSGTSKVIPVSEDALKTVYSLAYSTANTTLNSGMWSASIDGYAISASFRWDKLYKNVLAESVAIFPQALTTTTATISGLPYAIERSPATSPVFRIVGTWYPITNNGVKIKPVINGKNISFREAILYTETNTVDVTTVKIGFTGINTDDNSLSYFPLNSDTADVGSGGVSIYVKINYKTMS